MPEALRAKEPHDDTLATQRRRQIFDAVSRVLARKSFHEASVKEIAREAGIAAGSIYLYLRSKDDILVLIAESMVGELVVQLPAIHARGAGDPRRELLAMMRAILDIIDRYREAFSVLHHEARYLGRRPRYRQAMTQATEPYFHAVADVLERGRAAGAIRFEDVRSAVHVIHMLCAGWANGGNRLRDLDKEIYWREIAGIIEGKFLTATAPRANGSGRS
jgi:AcrR family transcriptional regulator